MTLLLYAMVGSSILGCSVRGPLHAAAAARAFATASDVITTMSNRLEGRASGAATSQATTHP